MNLKHLLSWVVASGLLIGSSDLFAQSSQSANLSWDASAGPGVASYVVYYGNASGSYSSSTNVGNRLTAAITGLQAGQRYFFVVTARTASGIESDRSNEQSYLVPLTPPVVALTSPVAGASYTSPAAINLAASVTVNGHTINKVQFYRGTTLLGEDASAPYSFAWNNVSTGNYAVTARAIYDTSSTAISPAINITVTSLPAPWQSVDIGAVGLAGSVSQSNGVYTVKGAGSIAGTADKFRFVYQTLSANGEIKAKLPTVATNGPSGRSGLMIRESLTSGSKYAFMGMDQKRTYRWQRRSNTSGSTSSTTSSTGTPPNVWTRLVRTNNTIYGYKSTNGVNWTQVTSRSITMAANIYVGLVVASGDTNKLSASVFSNVTVVP